MRQEQKTISKELFYYENAIAERIVASDHIVIYGARIVAKEVACCLMGEPYNCEIDAFMVTSHEGNPSELLGKKVVSIEEGKNLYKDTLILVAVLERYLDEILDTLKEQGFHNVIPLGFESDVWSGLRGNYFRAFMQKSGEEFLTIEQELEGASAAEKSSIHVYMANCHLDKKLSINSNKYAWEIPIQVGAELTDEKISEIRDNIGENISAKNREYCELTALYWIWKNDVSDYAGLCHYRRHFALNEQDIGKLGGTDVDVVLTIPILNFPSVRVMYENDHCIEDWDIMLEAIKELSPEYYETAEKLQSGNYYYAYNMFIARKEIFDSYCEWLFAILQYCEERCKPKESKYQNRYLGFLAERLLAIFFIHNKKRWKIVHCEKNFLS